MNSPFREILLALVLLFAIVWLITSRNIVPSKKIEAPASSLLHSLLLIAGFIIVFLNRFQTGLLALRLIPASLEIQLGGVFISVIGAGFAIWARLILGPTGAPKWQLRGTAAGTKRAVRHCQEPNLYRCPFLYGRGCSGIRGSAGIIGAGAGTDLCLA